METRKLIKIEMIKKDVTGAEIGRRAGVDRTAIYRCRDGLIKSYRLRKAIADALRMRVEELWPGEASGMVWVEGYQQKKKGLRYGEVIQEALRMRAEGQTLREISKKTGATIKTVFMWTKKYKQRVA